jgi:uncharacterized protein YabN with tetrapyrrole methylase and pyrophosphatase domain
MAPVDLYLLGSGIRGALQLTRETLQALATCRAVYVLHDDLMVHDAIREVCADVRDLADLYSGHTLRADVYRAISELLVAEAARQGPVGFVVHGHPLFLVSATEYTIELGRARGLNVRMLPAVSSFDTLLCDLEIDYGYGLQMYDATTLIQNQWKPNASVPTLIFQLATTMNAEVTRDEPSASVLRPLIDHLLKSYPPDHMCILVHSAAHLLEPTAKLAVKLEDLAARDDIELWRRPTLYVPSID